MLRTKNQFETFNDGVTAIYKMDEDGNPERQVEKLRFQERTVGIKRYYEAMTNKIQIDRLIRVHFRSWLTTGYLAVIEEQIYEIKQVQIISDAFPKSNDISLHFVRQRRETDGI